MILLQSIVQKAQVLKFNNAELDRRTGGIPLPSLTLVEGPNDSGKSVIVQQLTWSALNSGYKVCYITTEDTVRGLLSHMKSLSWHVDDFFIRGDFKITSVHIRGIRWNSEISKFYLIGLLNFVKRREKDSNVYVIDSLTYVITHAEERDILEFFSECRNLVDTQGKSFFITIHPYALNQELLIRVRSICDGHFLLSVKNFRDKNVLVLNIAKLRGALRTANNIVSFEVDPNFGIKVLPFSSAKA